MKLVSFGPAGKERPGVMVDKDTILDLYDASRGNIRTIRQVLDGEGGLEIVSKLLNSNNITDWKVPLESTRLGPPVTNPTKVIGVGLNYHSHTGEQDVKVPKKPLLFAKSATSISGDGDPIHYPIEDKQLDYEAELAVVIGKRSFRIDADKWEDHVAGYTVVNDVSGREAQFSDRKWFRGKSYDTCCPMGPYLVTKDEIEDAHNLNVTARLNGDKRQDSNTSKLIFNLPHLLSFISRNITLLPGDVISTGTPGGVGIFMDPPACMGIGDEIVVEVEKVGVLTNRVVERPQNEGPSVYPHPLY